MSQHTTVSILIVLLVVCGAALASPAALSPATAAPKYSAEDWDHLIVRIDNIINMTEPVSRNYKISATYNDISVMYKDLLESQPVPPEKFMASWASFATYASNSVGISIRKELPSVLEDIIFADFPPWLVDLIKKGTAIGQKVFDQMLEKTSKALAGGNVRVMAEVGAMLARFGRTFAGVTSPNEALWSHFESLYPDNDPITETLLQGFRAYYHSIYECPKLHTKRAIHKCQAEQFFYGSALMAIAEQARLQDFIAGAYPGNITIHIWPFPAHSWNPSPIVTKLLTILFTPDESLRTGCDVPRRKDSRSFPVELTTFQNKTIEKYVRQTVGQTHSLKKTRARDWTSLSDRMRYITTLFRSRFDAIELVTCPPFTEDQLARIWANKPIDSSELCFATCCKRNNPNFDDATEERISTLDTCRM